MENHYKTLGLTNAASAAEIRRAYRILARRYHPDVNPNRNSEALFKEIAQAYSVLSDLEKKKQYDLELKESLESFHDTFSRAHEALKRNQSARAYADQRERPSAGSKIREAKNTSDRKAKGSDRTRNVLKRLTPQLKHLNRIQSVAVSGLKRALKGLEIRSKAGSAKGAGIRVGEIAIIELSISMQDAIQGLKKTVALSESGNSSRKVSVNIPPGVRTGSVVRLRNKLGSNDRNQEEIVIIIKVETHPWLSIGERGLTMDVPLTIEEAIKGAKIQVPGFEEPLLVTVGPKTQSGKEVRLKGQGISDRDGNRGDLYIRFSIMIPDTELTPDIQSVVQGLGRAYSGDPRAHLPKRLSP